MHRQCLHVQPSVGPHGRRVSAHERNIVDIGGDVVSRECHLGDGAGFRGERELDEDVVETVLHGIDGPRIHVGAPETGR